jgi:hypothetical protein
MAGVMKHQTALLLDRLGRDEPHVGSHDVNRRRTELLKLAPTIPSGE